MNINLEDDALTASTSDVSSRPTEEWLDTEELDLSTHFDVFVKYQYARAFLDGTLTDYHRQAYVEHLRVFNACLELGTDGEPVKVGAVQFCRAFEQLLTSVSQKGFDRAHPVPLDPTRKPLNGAHRVAACMATATPVYAMHMNEPLLPNWGYRFFLDRGMDPELMDFGAAAMLSGSRDLRTAIIFGSAMTKRDQITRELSCAGQVLYEKTIQLSKLGKENLIRVIYDGEKWLGRREFGYLGARGKATPCFPLGAPSAATLVFLKPTISPEDLVRTKGHLRGIVGLGNHSIHITDTWAEAVRIGPLALNKNGVHLLNNKRYGRFPSFERDLSGLRTRLAESGIDPRHVSIVGSSVLSVYGIRDARDLDVIVAPAVVDRAQASGVDSSNKHWESYGFDIHTLVYDPSKHFLFEGMKCVGLEALIALKETRGESKDKVDLSLIELMVDHQSDLKARINRISLLLRLYSNLRWLRSYVGHWLVRLGLRVRRAIPR